MVPVDDALLLPGPLKQIRLDLTTKCNLRCVYCALSNPNYVGADMPRDVLNRAVELIRRISKYHPLDPIDVNGHGETTFLNGWENICIALQDADIPLCMTSNFAKQYCDNELRALARMRSIAVSIDTADADLLRKTRRKVDLWQILLNIQLVRQTADHIGTRRPEIYFLCGLYDKNSGLFEDFAKMAIATSVDGIGLWSLTPHAGLQVTDEQRVTPLDDLPDFDLKPRLRSIKNGLAILNKFKIPVNIQGDFIAALEKRVIVGN